MIEEVPAERRKRFMAARLYVGLMVKGAKNEDLDPAGLGFEMIAQGVALATSCQIEDAYRETEKMMKALKERADLVVAAPPPGRA